MTSLLNITIRVTYEKYVTQFPVAVVECFSSRQNIPVHVIVEDNSTMIESYFLKRWVYSGINLQSTFTKMLYFRIEF